MKLKRDEAKTSLIIFINPLAHETNVCPLCLLNSILFDLIFFFNLCQIRREVELVIIIIF